MSVVDPWEPGRVLTIRVDGRANPPLRAGPARIIRGVKDPSDREAKAQFLVVTKDPMPGLRVEPEGGESSPSQVEPLGEPGPDGRPRPFGVRCRPGRPIVAGIDNVVIHAPASSVAAVVVPMSVRKESAP